MAQVSLCSQVKPFCDLSRRKGELTRFQNDFASILHSPFQLNHELSRSSVHEFDMFFGTMSDVKNPAPTG